MSLGGSAKPINGFVVPLPVPEVRIIPISIQVLATAATLFLAATAATLAIGFREPRIEFAYEAVLFTLAGYWCSKDTAPAM